MQAETEARDSHTTVLAHLSDPHLPLPGGIPPTGLFNKRLLGLLSWYTKRRKRYRLQTLERLVQDMLAQAPDWITLTGDLTNLGLESEYRQARRWLDQIASPERLMLVPGNHDASVRGAWESGAVYWEPFWRGDDRHQTPGGVSDAFPVLRRRGQVALIGVSSAAASPAGFATGRVGEAQRLRLAALLRQTRAQGLFRVLLIHHPLIEGTVRRRKRLIDGPELVEDLAAEGVELVIHGHGHASHRREFETRDGLAPVIGVPSASSMHGELATYHLYRITRTAAGWDLESSARRIRGTDLEFETATTATQNLPRAHARGC